MSYEKDKMLEGIASVTFKDLMDFSLKLSDELIDSGEETIEPHIMALALSGVATRLIEEEAQRKAELAAAKKESQ